MRLAINQAFLGAGDDPNVSDVLKEARTLEPSYDLAAITGDTHPSPAPSPAPTCATPSTPEPEPSGGWFTAE